MLFYNLGNSNLAAVGYVNARITTWWYCGAQKTIIFAGRIMHSAFPWSLHFYNGAARCGETQIYTYNRMFAFLSRSCHCFVPQVNPEPTLSRLGDSNATWRYLLPYICPLLWRSIFGYPDQMILKFNYRKILQYQQRKFRVCFVILRPLLVWMTLKKLNSLLGAMWNPFVMNKCAC